MMKLKLAAAMTIMAATVIPVASAVRHEGRDVKVPTITIHALRYAFRPSEITLKQGQQVRLVFVTDDVPHGLTITELGLDVSIGKGKPVQVALTPSEVGNYSGRCSWYCGSGHSRMTFQVHVTQ
jgi:cytochrome c oxidase subunit II